MGAEGKENIGHLMSGRHIRMLPCDLNVLMLTKLLIGVVSNSLALREKNVYIYIFRSLRDDKYMYIFLFPVK